MKVIKWVFAYQEKGKIDRKPKSNNSPRHSSQTSRTLMSSRLSSNMLETASRTSSTWKRAILTRSLNKSSKKYPSLSKLATKNPSYPCSKPAAPYKNSSKTHSSNSESSTRALTKYKCPRWTHRYLFITNK